MKIFKNLKLRGKLIGGGAFAVLIPMLIVGVISVNTASKTLIESDGALRKKRLNIADRDYFKAVKADKSIIGIPVMSKASNMPVVVLSVPIKTKGKFVGMFWAVLKLNALSQASTGIEEVNLSVSQSSMVAQEIKKDINTVNQSSREMADRSDRVSLSAEDLSILSAQLDQMVSRFKV